MEADQKKIAARESLRILIFGSLILLFLVAVLWRESRPEWRQYQLGFLDVIQKHIGQSVDLKEIPSGIQQIHLSNANRVDRCQTCHLGINRNGLEESPLPYQTHPDPNLTWIHPIESFGCTLCHEGQGYALIKTEAHGLESPRSWSKPILPKEYLQASCGKCHNPDLMEQDAPILFAGRRLYLEKGCIDCHKIGQIGGTIGADHSNLARFSIRYLLESVLDPKANVPDSVMPALGFTEERAKTLLVFLLSLDATYIPHEYRTALQQ
jgi:cytochrome c553